MANKIICDKCKKEIKINIETKYLEHGIEIKFFRCIKCNTKYLIDVTDKSIREKQQEYRKLLENKKSLPQITTKENLKRIADKIKLLDTEMEGLYKEIKRTKGELKSKYTDQL